MKQIKLLGVLAIALTLGLASCNGGGNSGGEGGESQAGGTTVCEKHTWGPKETIKEPTCTEDGLSQRTCTVCGTKEEPKTIKAGHTWGEWTTVKQSTCAEAGKQERECSVCHTKEEKDLALADHNYVADTTKTNVAATCVADGINYLKCSVCGDEKEETVPATGHVYEQVDGADKVTWQREPSCTLSGVGTKTCTVCGDVANVTVAALGHNIQLIGDDTEPEAGKAKVRVYSCANGCGQTYLGFKANEPSADSLPHLVIDDDGGARFWGRPIGNALELSADGTSVNQQNGECVYDKNEPGDFFEYVFDLTADELAVLGDECYLYCDAKPADYLNGADFWAYGSNNDEWTPGFYIDDDPDHLEVDADGNPVMVDEIDHATGEKTGNQIQRGKRIEDYRYILYVDGEVKDFDPSIKNPTHGNNTNMTREEFILPYTFHLHTGTNRISLRMAGGYRSIFYNFTFRPVSDAAAPEDQLIKIKEWSCEDLEANRTDSGWESTKTFGDSKAFKFNKAGSVEVSYTAEAAQKAYLQLKIAVKYSNRNSTGFWKQSGAEKTRITINGTALAAGAEPDFSGAVDSGVSDNGNISTVVWYNIAEIDLIAGANTIKVEFLAGSYSYYLGGIALAI